jgi:hypothetical protein
MRLTLRSIDVVSSDIHRDDQIAFDIENRTQIALVSTA